MSTANRCADNGWQSVGTIFGFKHCHDELSFQQNQASLEKMRELLANGEKDVMPMINFVAGNMCDMLELGSYKARKESKVLSIG